MEIKNKDAFCEKIREQIRMVKAYYIGPRGISGGVTLWWRDEVNIKIRTTTHNLVDCEVRLDQQSTLMYVTWVYADAKPQRGKHN